MTGRKTLIYVLMMAVLPALIITIPTSQAQARNGRTAAFVFGFVAGATGTAIIYNHNRQRWGRVRNHYHRGYYKGCHTHNGVRHCHRQKRYRSAPVYYSQPKVYYKRPKAWSRSWYRYCSKRYRTFNPRTGYYFYKPGRKRLCR